MATNLLRTCWLAIGWGMFSLALFAQPTRTFSVPFPEGMPPIRGGQFSEKMTPELAKLWYLSEHHATSQLKEEWLNPGLLLNGEMVRVEIIFEGAAEEACSRFEALGLSQMAAYLHLADGWFPIQALGELGKLPGVRLIRPVLRPILHVGRATSQADVAMRTDEARETFNIDGTGVKIGVLSDSYNNLAGARSGILTGDLPGEDNPNGYSLEVDIIEDLDAGGTDEGRGMLELIHDIAPGAELAFATAFNGQASFAQNIRRLRNAGCDIIVDDVRYFADPSFQDGIIARAVDDVVAQGATYFSSAGNSGRDSYEGDFATTGEAFRLNLGEAGIFTFDAYDFAGGDAFQEIRIRPGATASIVLQWDNPYFSVSGAPGATTDLDLFLFGPDQETIVAQSITNNVGNDPVEIIQFTNEGDNETFHLFIGHPAGTPVPGRIKTILFSADYEAYQTESSTVYGQANARGAIAVGAAFYGFTPEFGRDPAQLESFSSRGGTEILFDALGNRIEAEVRLKPEFTAPDGTNTTFFGSDIGFDEDLLPNFFGTSASAPHAAAVAALLKEINLGLRPAEILDLLQRTALDMEAPGFDFDSGAGLIDAAAAIEQLQASLPIAFISLDVSVNANAAGLTWITRENTSVPGYEILLTGPFSDELVVRTVAAVNRQNERETYQSALNQLAPGNYQVQIRTQTADGQVILSPRQRFVIEESPLVFSLFSQAQQLTIRPNYLTESGFAIELFDLQGRQLVEIPFEAPASELPLGFVPAPQILVYRITGTGEDASFLQRGKFYFQ